MELGLKGELVASFFDLEVLKFYKKRRHENDEKISPAAWNKSLEGCQTRIMYAIRSRGTKGNWMMVATHTI